jgi:16S rRNA processing protein RimM
MTVSTKPTPDGKLCLGRITGAHGLKGEVRVESYTAVPEDIAAYGALSDESGARSFKFSSLRVVKDGNIVARIASVPDRATADSLRGVRLYVQRDDLPQLDDDEWYYADLIGLKALTAEGELIGEVASIQNFGAGDLVEIRLAENIKTTFVPFTTLCVPRIDVKLGLLVINPPWRHAEDQAPETS